jgi:hypothetical protein
MFTTSQSTKKERLTYDEYKSLSQDDQKRYKTEILEEMRDYHSNLLQELGVSRLDFQMKMAFYDKQARNVVGIFASEFKKEKGFYFELITREFEPLDENRTVYRIPYNPAFEEEYEMNEKGSYLVPLEELRMVNPSSVAISGPSALLLNEPKSKTTTAPKPSVAYKAPAPIEDAPYSDMTIRDYYAIHTGKPVSTKTWLNELIKSQK